MKAIVFLLALAGTAQAQEADTLVKDLGALIDAHHAGAAYTQLDAAVAKYPKDARLRYLYALAAFRTVHRDVMANQLDAGLAIDPGHGGLLSLRADLEMSRGELAQARVDAQKALDGHPEDTLAKWTLDQLGQLEQAQARLGARSTFTKNTPEWTADHVLERVFGGAAALELADLLDVELLHTLPEDERTRDNLVAAMVGMNQSLANDETTRGMHQHGWIVEPIAVDGWITAHVSIENTITQQRVDMVKKLLSSPKTEQLVSPDMKVLIDEVDPAEQSALLDRMVDLPNHAMIDVKFQLVAYQDRWRVAGLVIDGIDYGAQMATFAMMAEGGGLDKGDDEPKPLAYRLGYLLGAMGLLGGIVVAIVLGVRSSRR